MDPTIRTIGDDGGGCCGAEDSNRLVRGWVVVADLVTGAAKRERDR